MGNDLPTKTKCTDCDGTGTESDCDSFGNEFIRGCEYCAPECEGKVCTHKEIEISWNLEYARSIFSNLEEANTVLNKPEEYELSEKVLRKVESDYQWIDAIKNAKRAYDMYHHYIENVPLTESHTEIKNTKNPTETQRVPDTQKTKSSACRNGKPASPNQSQEESVYGPGNSVLVRADSWAREHKAVVMRRTAEGYKVQFDGERDVHECVFAPGALRLWRGNNCFLCKSIDSAVLDAEDAHNYGGDNISAARRRAMTSIPPIEPFDGQNFARSVVALAGVAVGVWILKRFLRKRDDLPTRTRNKDEI